jgi:hypothetical protein
VLYVTHIVMSLAAGAAALAAIPEGLGWPIRRWQLLVPAALAALAALMLFSYPSFAEFDHPELWMAALGAAVVGVARGHWMALDVDQIWNRMRVVRGRDGLAAAFAMGLLAAIEMMAVLAGLAGGKYQLTLQLGMALVAGYLVGRAGAAWIRYPDIPHSDLVDPAPIQE